MAELLKSGKYIKFAIYVLVVVLVNVAGTTLFFRTDLTANRVYSLSDASKKAVSVLSEPLTIDVFFTRNLPAPYNNIEQYLRDLLQEYAIYANKNFNYRFYNVSTTEGEISPQSRENQKTASNYGIHPVQIQVVEKDEVKFQKVYMGLVMIYGDLIERIPTITSTDGLEYRLTTGIQKMQTKIGALLTLPDKIQVKLFLSSALQKVAPYIGIQKMAAMPSRLQDIVAKINRKNYDKLAFEFVDPTAGKDLRAVAKKYNIMTLSWPELGKGKVPAGKGAIGLIMQYGQKTLSIPLMQVIRLPLIGTQYKLVAPGELEKAINENIEALIEINQKLGYLADHGTLNLSGANPFDRTIRRNQDRAANFRNIVANSYTLKDIRLKEQDISADLNCLVIARPTETFSDYELFQIDQFLMQGKNLFLVLDRFREMRPPGQQAAMANRPPVYVPLNSGLQKLLEHYGIRIKQSYVMDENCYKQQLPTQFGGGERPIYFAPLIKNRNINKKLPFMRNIKGLVALKISPLELVPERIKAGNLKAFRLFASSTKSWEMRGRITFNPLFIQPPSDPDAMQSYPLAYLLEGQFPSYFAGKPIPQKEAAKKDAAKKEKEPQKSSPATKSEIDLSKIKSAGRFIARGKPAKIFVMASSAMLSDNVLDVSGKNADAVFIMNVLDELNNRSDIAVMRGKQQRFNPLNDTSARTKMLAKTINVAGLPVLVVCFGLVVWWRRRARKKHIRMMFQK